MEIVDVTEGHRSFYMGLIDVPEDPFKHDFFVFVLSFLDRNRLIFSFPQPSLISTSERFLFITILFLFFFNGFLHLKILL